MPEGELIHKLITVYLELTTFKKQKINSFGYEKKCSEYEEKYGEIKKQLRVKLSGKVMNEVQRILNDCEELISHKLELENELKVSSLLIEKHKQTISLRASVSNKKQGLEKKAIIKFEEEKQNFLESKIESIQNEIKKISSSQQTIHFSGPNQHINIITGDGVDFNNQVIYQINYNEQQLQKELAELKQKYQEIEPVNEFVSDQQKLKKTILFLATKQKFAEIRETTINSLINIHKELDKSGKGYDKITKISKYIRSIELISISGIAGNLLDKGISIVANFFKKCSLTKHAQKFEECLIEDEKATLLLQKTYQSLSSSLQKSKNEINPIITEILKLNQIPFSSHSVFKISGIKRGKYDLTIEKIKQAIDLLTKDLKEFVKELQQEKVQYAEKFEKFFSI